MGKCQYGEDAKAFGDVLCLAVGSNGKTLVVGGASRNVCVYSIEYGASKEGRNCVITESMRVTAIGTVLSLALDDAAEVRRRNTNGADPAQISHGHSFPSPPRTPPLTRHRPA